MQLTTGQQKALDVMLGGNDFAIVAGYAGTGKTTLIRAVAKQANVIICAPTGKAALRVTEATGQKARTVHRWIYKPVENQKTGEIEFVRREIDDIERADLIIIDEASMVGTDMWEDIRAVQNATDVKVRFVGDGFQLPPVESTRKHDKAFSLFDTTWSKQADIVRVELTEVMRQAADNPIIAASMALRERDTSAMAKLRRYGAGDAGNVALKTATDGHMVICWTNSMRMRLNHGIRAGMSHCGALEIGEPLLCLKNTYKARGFSGDGLFNGEIARVTDFASAPIPATGFNRFKKTSHDVTVQVLRLETGDTVAVVLEEIQGQTAAIELGWNGLSYAVKRALNDKVYDIEDMPPYMPASYGYALTCHKSQGSQSPYVFVCVEPGIARMPFRYRWLYTAITRAQETCEWALI